MTIARCKRCGTELVECATCQDRVWVCPNCQAPPPDPPLFGVLNARVIEDVGGR